VVSREDSNKSEIKINEWKFIYLYNGYLILLVSCIHQYGVIKLIRVWCY